MWWGSPFVESSSGKQSFRIATTSSLALGFIEDKRPNETRSGIRSEVGNSLAPRLCRSGAYYSLSSLYAALS